MEELKWLYPFKAPETPLEALERSLEWARDESRWSDGVLCEWKDRDKRPKDVTSITAPEELAKVCHNVKACAMGILMIAMGNGRTALDIFLSRTKETWLLDQSGGEEATLLLARGFHPRGKKFTDFREAASFVEAYNDDWAEESDFYDENSGAFLEQKYLKSRSEHHARIVRGFERAVKYAAAEQGE